jgi:hypothetical protein
MCYSFTATTQPNGWCKAGPDMIETIAKAGIAVGVDGLLLKPF